MESRKTKKVMTIAFAAAMVMNRKKYKRGESETQQRGCLGIYSECGEVGA